MKTNIHFLLYLAQFFLEWKLFQIKVVEKIKTHILCSITPPLQKLCCLWDNVEKYCIDRQATDDNILWHMCIACWITKSAYTHSDSVIFVAFPPQEWLHECAWVLGYTYITCLVVCIGRILIFLVKKNVKRVSVYKWTVTYEELG
jgi:hypothetical protein